MRKTLFLLAFVAGCAPDKPPPPAPPPALKPSAEIRPAPEASLPAFDLPAGWAKVEPANRMRKAQYRVPDKEKEHPDAELVLFFFGPSRAQMEANIQRWAGQMGAAEAKEEQVEGGKCKITFVDIPGTYRGDLEGDPISNARMLAAVVEASDGPWYFKLVGPGATVGDWRDEFLALLKGAHK